MPDPLILSIVRDGSNVVISWTGGEGPFQLEKSPVFPPIWSHLFNPTIATSKTVPMDTQEGYFRVQDQVPLLVATEAPGGVQLLWDVPDLT